MIIVVIIALMVFLLGAVEPLDGKFSPDDQDSFRSDPSGALLLGPVIKVPNGLGNGFSFMSKAQD
jgi:hypothetical protein